jgi:putative flippase GtrA
MKLINNQVTHEFIKFIFFGALRTLLTYTLFLFFTFLNFNPYISSSLVFFIGFIFTFFVNEKLVFSVDHRNFLLVPFSIYYVLYASIFILLLYVVNTHIFSSNFSFLIVVLFMLLPNFILTRYIFKTLDLKKLV